MEDLQTIRLLGFQLKIWQMVQGAEIQSLRGTCPKVASDLTEWKSIRTLGVRRKSLCCRGLGNK